MDYQGPRSIPEIGLLPHPPNSSSTLVELHMGASSKDTWRQTNILREKLMFRQGPPLSSLPDRYYRTGTVLTKDHFCDNLHPVGLVVMSLQVSPDLCF